MQRLGPSRALDGVTVGRAEPIGSEATLRADAVAGPARLSEPQLAQSLLHPLRRLRATEALDLGFALFRVQARVLVPIATLLYLPVQLVNLALRLAHDPQEGWTALTTTGFGVLGVGSMLGYEPFVLVAQSVVLALLGICCGRLTAALIEQHTLPLGQVLRFGFRRFVSAVAVVALSAAVHIPFLLIPGVGFLIAGSFTFMTAVIVGAEGIGAFSALKRNIEFARITASPALGLYLGGLVLLSLVRVVLLAGPMMLAQLLGAPKVLLTVLADAAGILLVFVQPLTATLAAGAYVMFRTRAEGLDLRLRIEALPGAAMSTGAAP